MKKRMIILVTRMMGCPNDPMPSAPSLARLPLPPNFILIPRMMIGVSG